MVADGVDDFLPSGAGDALDVFRGLGGDETVAVGIVHGSTVVDNPDSEWKGDAGFSERVGEACGVALLGEL